MGVGLQANEEDGRLHLVGAKDPLELPLVGHGLADRLRALVDHVEGVVHRHMGPEPRPGQQAAVLQHGAQVVAHAHLAHELLGA